MIEEQLTKYWDWGRGSRVLEDDEDLMLQFVLSWQGRGADREAADRRSLLRS